MLRSQNPLEEHPRKDPAYIREVAKGKLDWRLPHEEVFSWINSPVLSRKQPEEPSATEEIEAEL
jgi:hypothetical protein